MRSKTYIVWQTAPDKNVFSIQAKYFSGIITLSDNELKELKKLLNEQFSEERSERKQIN